MRHKVETLALELAPLPLVRPLVELAALLLAGPPKSTTFLHSKFHIFLFPTATVTRLPRFRTFFFFFFFHP